jgi:quercetin dioxygenase-like cupin family protein
VLFVTSGKGIVATEQEQVEIQPGDIIHIPAGEKHWHGAAQDSEMSHLAIEAAGGELTQLEE